MALDARGILSLVEIIIYLPVLFAGVVITLRHGFQRRAGWLFLLILAIIRIVGGSIHIAAEQSNPPNKTLFTVSLILESAGVSPLLLATLGFLSTITDHAFPDGRLARPLRLLGVLAIVALALTIAGGTQASNATPQNPTAGLTLRHVGGILYMALYAALVLLHGYLWAARQNIMMHRRKLLVGVSAALPFLFVRVLYSVLSAFSPTLTAGQAANGLSKFNSISGSWPIYLIMSIVMEYIVIIIYCLVGITTPADRDEYAGAASDATDDDVPLSRRG
ncbi:hypothetical protein K474DRAFT_1705077 [Panus rudis PR-1116 ss-1]|nr:hypothetical protein K474DRAFT_1705077 [Panus rudis PR-1116 ss-1]